MPVVSKPMTMLSAANRRAMGGLNVKTIDKIPQRVLDRLLWRAIKGPHVPVPAPGPNADDQDAPDPDD